MLQPADFAYPVEHVVEGKKAYWIFRGELYRDYENFVLKVMRAGEAYLAPGTGIVRVHQEDMTHNKCRLLAAMLQVQGAENKWLRYPEDMPKLDERDARGFDTNYNYLRFFGLAEHAKSDHKKGKGVKWRATEHGRAFIMDNALCPAFIRNQGSTFVTASEEGVQLSNFYSPEAIDAMRNEPGFWRPLTGPPSSGGLQNGVPEPPTGQPQATQDRPAA